MTVKTRMMVKKNQQGAVLVVGLILLVVLIILGITAYNMTSVGEKMSGNQRNKDLSKQAAESAINDGEQWLKFLTNAPDTVTTCASPPCEVWALSSLPDLTTQSASWWATNAHAFSGTLEQVESQPHYIIVEHSFVPYELSPDARAKGEGYYFYTITARGTGGNDEATSMIESTYAVQYK